MRGGLIVTLIRKRSALIGSTLIGSLSAVTMGAGHLRRAAEATRILGVRPGNALRLRGRG